MSRIRRTRTPVQQSFPRVSGDEPGFVSATATDKVFSPRERG